MSELGVRFVISPPAISRHLRVLDASGLILQERHGSWRTNSLQAKPLEEVAAYLDRYRVFLSGSFDLPPREVIAGDVPLTGMC